MTSPTAKPAPLCRDCEHMVPAERFLRGRWLKWLLGEWERNMAQSMSSATCSACERFPEVTNIVTGEVDPAVSETCNVARMGVGPCGRSGRLFKQKEAK